MSPSSARPLSGRRILIVLPRQLGDILLGTPLLQVLCEEGVEEVGWYAHPMATKVLGTHPGVSRLHLYPINPMPPGGMGWRQRLKAWWDLAAGEWGLLKSVRRHRYDTILDAMGTPRTALWGLLTGIPLRVGFSIRSPMRAALYSRVVAPFPHPYVGFQRLSLATALGVHIPLSRLPALELRLVCPEQDALRVHQWLQSELENTPNALGAVVMSPTQRHPVRRWPGEKWVHLAQMAWEQKKLKPIWIWGPGEKEEVEALSKSCHQLGIPSALTPLFSLAETAALGGAVSLWVGNTNGLLHAAVAGGAHTVEIHGPTHAQDWCHPDTQKHASAQRALGCVACEQNACRLPRRECLEDLSVEEVWEKAISVLKANAPSVPCAVPSQGGNGPLGL